MIEVIWSNGQSCHRLVSSQPQVLPEALKVFGHDLCDSVVPTSATFSIESSKSGHQWWAIHPQGYRRRFGSLQRTLTYVEYAAVASRHQDPEACVLHAAFLHRQGQGLAIVGPCGSGKSTLGQALWQSGWDFLSDDNCELGGHPELGGWPLSRRVSLRRGSFRWLKPGLLERIRSSPGCQTTRKGLVFHPRDLMPVKLTLPIDVGYLILLTGRNSGSSPGPVNPIEAMRALMPHSSAGRRGLQEGLKWLSPWVEHWQALRLGRQSLEEMLDIVGNFTAPGLRRVSHE